MLIIPGSRPCIFGDLQNLLYRDYIVQITELHRSSGKKAVC